MICAYGCDQEGKYQFKNGKWCCSKSFNMCPFIRNEKSKKLKGKFIREKSPNYKKPAWNKSKKWEEIIGLKEAERRKKEYSLRMSIYNKNRQSPLKGKKQSYEVVKKRTENRLLSYNKHSLITKNKISKSKKYTIKDYNNKYPFFSKIEEMRYNPDKPGEKEIQVHCKNHNCSNSKEKDGWFTPTKTQIYERIRQLEKNGFDHAYFYCCEECKEQCPLYYSKGNDPFKVNIKPYTTEEYQQFREHVLKRDNYECQYCGAPAEHVHHERPQILEPFFSLDPDLAWSTCKKCHYQKGHKNYCSSMKLFLNKNNICI